MKIIDLIAKKLNLRAKQVENTVQLLTTGATIPFVSRYRKEATGGLNEVQVSQVKEEHARLEELVHRRDYILQTIEEQGKLTDDLRLRIADCWDATVLEDFYLPFKPKRKTRAEVARKRGLEPLALTLLMQPHQDPEKLAVKFVKGEVSSVDDALQGARDILAEQINEDERSRQTVRRSFERTALIRSKVVKSKEAEAEYRDYFDWEEPLRQHPPTACWPCVAVKLRLPACYHVQLTKTIVCSVERPYVKPGTPAARESKWPPPMLTSVCSSPASRQVCWFFQEQGR